MKILASIIVDVMAFLELSGDDIIESDCVIKVMEMIVAANLAAVSAHSEHASDDRFTFFSEFSENLDLSDNE